MTADRRQRLIRFAYFAVATIAVAAALVAPVVVPRWREGDGERTVAASGGAFAQHYVGMDTRRRAAGVPTMGETAASRAHFHPKLAVFIDGARIEVPRNIGIDPRQEGAKMAALHTHSEDGTIHVEGMPSATLGQFFRVWGVEFSGRRLGAHRASNGRRCGYGSTASRRARSASCSSPTSNRSSCRTVTKTPPHQVLEAA